MNVPEEDKPRLVRLSAELERLDLPQQSDKFVAALRQAVRDEVIEASYVEGRCELPKKFRYKSNAAKRKSIEDGDGTYVKRTPEMLILVDAGYQDWFETTKTELSRVEFPELRPENQGRMTHSPTAAAMLADSSLELFYRGVATTRQRLKKQQAHGKSLATKRGFTHKDSADESSPHASDQPIESRAVRPGRPGKPERTSNAASPKPTVKSA